jgi:hypothetical protein
VTLPSTVASDARRDIVWMILFQLLRQVRIGEHRASYDQKVGLAIQQRMFAFVQVSKFCIGRYGNRNIGLTISDDLSMVYLLLLIRGRLAR